MVSLKICNQWSQTAACAIYRNLRTLMQVHLRKASKTSWQSFSIRIRREKSRIDKGGCKIHENKKPFGCHKKIFVWDYDISCRTSWREDKRRQSAPKCDPRNRRFRTDRCGIIGVLLRDHWGVVAASRRQRWEYRIHQNPKTNRMSTARRKWRISPSTSRRARIPLARAWEIIGNHAIRMRFSRIQHTISTCCWL